MNAPATDLFSYEPPHRPKYPRVPGHRNTDTSLAAAKAMEPRAGTIKAAVLDALDRYGPLATFELPAKIGRTYRATQPRTSELCAEGLIVDSGVRREDPETGKCAVVWRRAG